MLVQGEDGGGLRVSVGAEFIEEEGESVFVVGYQGGEGGVVGCRRRVLGLELGDAGLQRGAFGSDAGCCTDALVSTYSF